MLVLSRKPGERILIGDNVAITVVRIGPNSVRLGIDAPRDMNIVREELCQGLPGATPTPQGIEIEVPLPS
jgi:carbon storage regulator